MELECSGKVDHVRFRFEDTGSSLSASSNASLYDTAGGNKIDGLEVELQYSENKVNIDNTTLADTGSHGVVKAAPDIIPLYDSVSSAAFQARCRQNGTISKSGTEYTGL